MDSGFVQPIPLALPSVDPGSLINHKVYTRWPEDNNFYEATITQYNPVTVGFNFHYCLLLDANMHQCPVTFFHDLFRVSIHSSMTWAHKPRLGNRLGFVM
jgi:hypothetical protein